MVSFNRVAFSAEIRLLKATTLAWVVAIKFNGHVIWNLINLWNTIIKVSCQYPTLSCERCNNIDFHVGNCQLHFRVTILFTGHDVVHEDLIVLKGTSHDTRLPKNTRNCFIKTRNIRRYLSLVIVNHDFSVLRVGLGWCPVNCHSGECFLSEIKYFEVDSFGLNNTGVLHLNFTTWVVQFLCYFIPRVRSYTQLVRQTSERRPWVNHRANLNLNFSVNTDGWQGFELHCDSVAVKLTF